MTKLENLADFRAKSAQTKICNNCHSEFPLSEEFWYKARPRPGHMKEGWQSNCRSCWKEVNRRNKLRRKGVCNY